MKAVVEAIINIPYDFKTKDKSIYSLLESSGYFELYDNVNEKDIYQRLKESPQLITEWLLHSSNKRVNCGWYFSQYEDGNYIVGFYPKLSTINDRIFSDKVEACSVFVKREIERIRTGT